MRNVILGLALLFGVSGQARADISDSGSLTIGGQSVISGTVTVQGNAFSVGGSTLYVTAGGVGISTNLPTGLFTVGQGTMVVTQAGNVGIGTTSPADLLVIRKNQNASTVLVISNTNAGVNADGRIQLGSDSFTTNFVEANDVSDGMAQITTSNDQGFLIRTSNAAAIFRVDTNGANERFRVHNNGYVGINQTSPAYQLDVSSVAHATSFTTSSDERFKENVQPLNNVLERLKRIRGVSFDWNAKYQKMGRATEGRQIGLIAQEVEKQFPELVTRWSGPDQPLKVTKDPQGYHRSNKDQLKWEHDYRSMDYNRFTAVLLEAIKEQQKQIEAMALEIKELKNRR